MMWHGFCVFIYVSNNICMYYVCKCMRMRGGCGLLAFGMKTYYCDICWCEYIMCVCVCALKNICGYCIYICVPIIHR